MSSDAEKLYMVQLLGETPPRLDAGALLAAFRAWCPRVAASEPVRETLVFHHPDHTAPVQGTDLPLTHMFMVAPGGPDTTGWQPALEQSWDWAERHTVVSSCRGCLVVSDMLGHFYDYRTRLGLFHQAVQAALAVMECRAIHWTPAQRMVDPRKYQERRQPGSDDALFPAVNVRLYRMPQQGVHPEILMDTTGLAALGLPDLQCHFHDLDIGFVGTMLNTGAYEVFEKGDFLQDGDTVESVVPGFDAWQCRHEVSLALPRRLVIDFDPGPRYAVKHKSTPPSALQ
jgi:hypothetical protein